MWKRILEQILVKKIMLLAGGLLLVFAAGCNPGQTGPLGYGWTCACAITNDDVDRSDRCLAQKMIALAYVAEGDVKTARACAVQIEDYNKGLVLAAVAEWLITHGERAQAEAILPEIEACRFTARDWQRDYLQTAITRVQALLGKEKTVISSAVKFNDHSGLGGDVAANLALVLSRTGRVAEATGILDDLAKTNGVQTADSSVRGFLDLAVQGRLDRTSVTQMVVKAWESTDHIKPYRRWDLQLDVIEVMTKLGFGDEARVHLTELTSNVVAAVKLPPDAQASMLCRGSILWNKLGEPGKSETLRGVAEKALERKLEDIFQPGTYATIAGVYAETGDMTQARICYARALDLAAGLENRRPRAQAGVAVCVSLAGHKGVIDAGIQKGLDRLRETFDAAKP